MLATGRCAEILGALPYRFAVSRYVAEREVLRLHPVPGGAPTERGPFLSDPGAGGLVVVQDLRSPRELEELVRFAAVVNYGEASVCALAVVHGGAVATDDRKVLRLLREEALGIEVLQTPELLHEWAVRAPETDAEVGRVLRAIETRARFVPRRDAPHFDWWMARRERRGGEG